MFGSAASNQNSSGTVSVEQQRERIAQYFDVPGSTSREYVEHRVRELARGTCLGAYRWNGGGEWQRRAWSSELPSDAQIVMHVFCTYMNMLLPMTAADDTAPFVRAHVATSPLTPQKLHSSLMLYQAQLHPPHYDVLLNKYLVPLPRGASNLFDALSVFVYCVQKERDGFLSYVSLADPNIRLIDVVK